MELRTAASPKDVKYYDIIILIKVEFKKLYYIDNNKNISIYAAKV